MLNFNVAPYFNDFKDEQNFYKTLFVPTRPVQTRELNQIQSVLQNQIKSHADHIFKNGSMVIPGHVYYDSKVYSVKLLKLYNDISTDLVIDNLVGRTLVSADTGVSALVLHYDLSTNVDDPIVYVKFISSSLTDQAVKEFKSSDVIYDRDDVDVKLKLVSTDAVSKASIVSVNEGIYYVNGYFVRVAKQTITLEKFNNTPTWRAGLEFRESIVTAVEDNTLYDNALGYSNYAAPGADRYKIDLVLSKRTFDFDDQETVDADGNTLEEKFLDLIQVKEGVVVREINATEYSEIEKMLAQRTSDESGDYEVVPFTVTPKEYRNNVRADWKSGVAYLEGDYVKSNDLWWEALNDGISGPTAPNVSVGYKMSDGAITWVMVNTITSNKGIYLADDTATIATHNENFNKVAYQVKPGKAYIKGFGVETKTDQYVIGDKALDYEQANNELLPTVSGTYSEINNLRGLPNISTYELVDIFSYSRAEIASFSSDRTTATCSVTITGDAVTAITIDDAGYGYDPYNPPAITISGAPGVNATARVIVSPTGEIEEIRVLTQGSGYPGGTTATIDAPPATAVKVGTCRIRSLDYSSGTIGDATATFTCQMFDVDLLPVYNWGLYAKSFASQGSGGFASDIVEQKTRLPGLVSVTGLSTPTKELVGVGTSFINQVLPGHPIIIGGSIRRRASRVVNSDSILNVTSPIAVDLTAQTVDIVGSSFYSASVNLMTGFSKKYVRNVRSSDDTTINMSYSVRRHKDDLTPSGGIISIALTVDNETFAPLIAGNYVVSNKITGAIIAGPNLSLDGGAKTLTISGLAGVAHEVMITVEKTSTAAREKTKTREIKILDITNKKDLEKAIIQLNEADVYRLMRVLKADGEGTLTLDDYASWATASATGTTDITKYFIVNNGQTSTYYGLGSISKAKACPLLNNTVRIVFEYFNHSAGDFFTTNSYIDVPQDKIDPFLRDSVDFRPRISDDGSGFSAAGASITEPCALNTHFKVNYSYFLPRNDIITIDIAGKIETIKGKSSTSLREPSPSSNSIVLCNMILSPGSFNVGPTTVEVVKKDHKRYTMADIGKLDRRIQNLEYYTQLTLLEQDVVDKTVLDQNGLDRFKSGILTDDFKSTIVSASNHQDFLCALDLESGECRAFADVTSVQLGEKFLSNTQRQTSHYAMTGDFITLPYTNVVSLSQSMGSNTEFVNPFAVMTFNGELNMFPSQDIWFEERRAPNVVRGDPSTNTSWTGTTWNSWQNSWTGASFMINPQHNIVSDHWTWAADEFKEYTVAVNNMVAAGNIPTAGTENQFFTGHFGVGFGNTGNAGGGEGWDTKLGTVSVTGTGERTGTTTTVNTWTEQIQVDDRIIDTSSIPFIRTRPVVFRSVGMRPLTTIHAFFAGVDVSKYVKGLTEVVVNGSISGSFNTYDGGAVDDESNTARRIGPEWFTLGGSSDVSFKQGVFFDRGDVVNVFNGSTNTGATAVVVDVVKQINSVGAEELVIKLVAEKNSGSFNWATPPSVLTNYTLRSSTGNTTAAVSIVRNPGLVTNSYGTVFGVFTIPNNSTHKFETGSRLLRLTDDPTNNTDLSTTEALSTYTASGTVSTRQVTVANITRSETIVTQVSESSATSAQFDIAYKHDPLAQTFVLAEEDGAFITQAEVYFSVKDTSLPVRCEIRSVVNGYPGPTILAQKSLRPDEINVNLNQLVPTVFTFPRPTYLQGGVEYCIVLLSDSNKYKVFIARMGELIVGTNRMITSQPSMGSLFKSQNNSTWTAEQLEDLTFKLYKAKFDISKAATVDLVNKRLPTVSLSVDPMYSLAGSNVVRVFHPNHGFLAGDTVSINGVFVGASGPFAALGTTYLAGNEMTDEKTYIVSNVEYDFYTITITDSLGAVVNAAYTSAFGGSFVESTYQVQFSTVSTNLQTQTLPGTTASFTMQTLKGDVANAYIAQQDVSVLNRENTHFTSPMLIASHENEATRLSKNKSVRVRATLTSTSENISPIIDIERAGLILIRNKINNPSLAQINFSGFDDVTLCTSKTLFWMSDDDTNNGYFQTTDNTIFDDFDKLSVGKYVTSTAGINSGKTFRVAGKLSLTIGGTPTYRVMVEGADTFVHGTDSAASLTLHNRYVDESAPYNTTALSSYISQAMRLNVSATGARITLDSNVPAETTYKVYYRSLIINSDVPLHETPWVEMTPKKALAATANFSAFTEVEFEVNDIPIFDIIQTKVTFFSDNVALTPRIKALRMLALA